MDDIGSSDKSLQFPDFLGNTLDTYEKEIREITYT